MRITRVSIRKPSNQLKPIQINGLGDVVALVGKNGSGKSRILQEIQNYPNKTRTSDFADSIQLTEKEKSMVKKHGVGLTDIERNVFYGEIGQSRIRKIDADFFKTPIDISDKNKLNLSDIIKPKDDPTRNFLINASSCQVIDAIVRGVK
jgi:ABC-type Na+ transport system ATPase subunit NatA